MPITPNDTPKTHFDVQDGLLIVGFLLLETGVALIYIPAALILAGVLFILSVVVSQAVQAKGNK